MKQALVITELQRTIVGGRKITMMPSMGMVNHFPIPLSWRSFKVGSSEPDGPDNEVYCPCGDTICLGDDYYVLGDFVEVAEKHIADKHPGVRTS
jgi:hypothetical protein